MPHAGITPALELIAAQDRAIRAIPEVDSVVGKIGRAETVIDPVPISMIETVILYKTEYQRDPTTGELVVDENDNPIRQWREHIKSPRDIWREVQKAAEFPGSPARHSDSHLADDARLLSCTLDRRRLFARIRGL